jgi:recombination protein RecT
MASILPRHLTAERMARVVLVEASRNPKLYECTPATLATCIMTVAQIGLEPSSPLGHAYLIPRWNSKANATECTLLLGYKGLCELARRSGEVARITAEVVYRDEMDRGLWRASVEPPEVEHRWAPDVNRDEENIVAAYARAVLKDGSVAQVVLTVADIEKRKGRSQARGNGPWVTDYAAMARKSALRALLSGGLVPLSSELATALDVDADQREAHRLVLAVHLVEDRELLAAGCAPAGPEVDHDHLPAQGGELHAAATAQRQFEVGCRLARACSQCRWVRSSARRGAPRAGSSSSSCAVSSR